jgi:hypothetical protein
MAPVIGYGEDSLTYWALRTGRLLRELGHQEQAPNVLILYRPSFGRHGGLNRAEFGEFDALIGTTQRVYLIESKWAVAQRDGEIVLKDHQVFRHRFFEHLRNEWRDWHTHSEDTSPRTWAAFCEWVAVQSRRDNWHPDYRDKRLASDGSKLAGNLEWVLTRLEQYQADIEHILVNFHRTGTPCVTNVRLPDPFDRLIPIPFALHEPIGRSRFFMMEPASPLV